jgi:hypothetical protein
LGAKGADALKDFAAQGGTVILFNHASDYATEALGVKAMNALRGVATKEFYSPGSLLNVSLDLASPLAYGMPEEITLWSEQSPAWQGPEGHVVARYPSSGVLASGWLLGEKYLVNQAALVDVKRRRRPYDSVRDASAIPRPELSELQAAVQCIGRLRALRLSIIWSGRRTVSPTLGCEAAGISFPSAWCFQGLFHNPRGRLLCPSPPHQNRWRRGRQIFNLHPDREALASDLSDDRRNPRSSGGFGNGNRLFLRFFMTTLSLGIAPI